MIEKTKEIYNRNALEATGNAKICLKCDYCLNEYDGVARKRKKANELVDKDACFKCRFKKREDVSLAKHGVKNSSQRPDVRKKISDANAPRLKSEEYKEQVRQTNLDIFGHESAMQSEEIKQKHKNIMFDKHGVENASQVEGSREKAGDTMFDKYGSRSYTSSDIGKEHIKQVVNDRFGVDNVFQNEEIKQQIKETNNIKYGYDYPLQDPERAKKHGQIVLQSKIKSGKVRTHENKTVKEWAEQNGFSRSRFSVLVTQYGFESAVAMTPHESSLETRFKQLLEELNIKYEQQFRVGTKKADFFLPEKNIICECDSLYWHSESEQTNNNYHVEKRQLYLDNGYYPLFFREEEINNTPNIVKSIILNKLEGNNKIFARKCNLSVTKKDDIQFFKTNHLMGNGNGYCFWLEYMGEMVSCMAIKRTNIANGEYEVSRFCNILNTSITGGFSRLLSYAISNLKDMKQLSTFIDLRYGSGQYLTEFGFVKSDKAYPSFRWTNGSISYGRMKFTGSTGYDNGYTKIWDCGQQKYTLNK